MPNLMPVAAALGLIAAPIIPAQSASACGPQKICSRPAPPRGPIGPGFNGPAILPGPQGPGVQGPGVQGPGAQNQNGQNQNGQTNNSNDNQNQAQNNQNQTQQAQNQAQQQTAQPVSIPVGSRVTLPGNYGSQPGMVYLVIGNVKLPMLAESWDESGITLTLPNVQITSAQQVKIEIAPANNGQVAALDITLNPTPKVIVLDQPVVVPTQTAEVAPDAPEPRS